MKVKGSVIPPVPFSVEQQPKKPDMALVRFYENVEPYTEEIDGMTASGYIYDEFQLELPYYPALADDIAANLDVYLNEAKAAEEQSKPIEERVDELKNVTNDLAKQIAQEQFTVGGAVAQRLYQPGEYVTVDGTLYRVTLPIPAGGRVAPGTNAVATTVVDELKTTNGYY